MLKYPESEPTYWHNQESQVPSNSAQVTTSIEAPALAPSLNLSALHHDFYKPGLTRLMQILKMDVCYQQAEGVWLQTRFGKVLDLIGGYGSTILGHNHPELISEIQRLTEEKVAVHAQGSIQAGAAELAYELNVELKNSFPHSCEEMVVHFLSSGTEAMEAAIKHALMAWNRRREHAISNLIRMRARRLNQFAHQQDSKHQSDIEKLTARIGALRTAHPVFVALTGAFHGKTAGALGLTANPNFSSMFVSSGIEVLRIAPNCDAQGWSDLAQRHMCHGFSTIAGGVIEFIQGEGGIRPLSEEFMKNLRNVAEEFSFPVIADEIQTGMYRTGRFLAAEKYGFQPDYIALGKSLGGGVAKISALMVRRQLYQESFDLIHSSTFAGDDLSCRLALKTLRILRRERHMILISAHAFEAQVRRQVDELKQSFPGVIKELRGSGFMLGIEFFPVPPGHNAGLLQAVAEAGFFGHFVASFFLNRHRLRLGMTLSDSNTIRIEPSALITNANTQIFLNGLRDLCRRMYAGQHLALCSHLIPGGDIYRDAQVSSHEPVSDVSSDLPQRNVVFLSHFIDDNHIRLFDPLLSALTRKQRQHLMTTLGPLVGSCIYHSQTIKGKNGATVRLILRGIIADSQFFWNSLRLGDDAAFQRVVDALHTAEHKDCAQHVGLGQFTSIVSTNGLQLAEPSRFLTTGNSLTVGFAFASLCRRIKESGKTWDSISVGLVGIAGNIGSVLAQLIGDKAQRLILVHRRPLQDSPEFESALANVIEKSNISAHQVLATHDPSALQECDVVVLSTNSTAAVVDSIHLKAGCIILDISVPANISRETLEQRPDISYLQGGFAQLPLGQRLQSKLVPAPDGQVYACMGETIMTSLMNYQGSFSLGPLTKSSVQSAMRAARKVGIGVGHCKVDRAF